MSIEFNCESCGKHYKVADAMAGKRAKCKACGGVIQVPALAEAPPQASAVEADVPTPAPAAPIKAPPPRPVPAKAPAPLQSAAAQCPSCQAPLAPNAVLCISCGFDLRKGVKIAGVTDNEDEAEAAASDSETDTEDESTPDTGKKRWWGRFWSK